MNSSPKTFSFLFLEIALFIFMMALFGCDDAPSRPLPPDDALLSFELADDTIKIELVASEPMVQDPVAITFDEGGRLWVVEMLGFMQDIDGTGEDEKVGRISVLFDDDQDGKMDRSTIFLDSLVLPRAIAVVDGGALVSENIPLWYIEDTDGDFKADKKTLVDPEYGGLGMPEHSANGLWRGLDNWYYNAKSKYRYRRIDGEWKKEETEFRGQWGICHDDTGRLFYNYNWSQLHADLVPPNFLNQNKNHTSSSGIDHGLTPDRRVFPIRSNTAINRGYVPGTLDERGRILEFASACGPLINRGRALPDSFYGDAFVCEPTANLIKRNKIVQKGFMLSAEGAYNNKEFLASTDERFRPISLASGPDGAIYVVDMYKGIIQHGPYMTPYLREETLKRGLDKPIHMGRIWRIVAKEKSDRKIPDLENADTSSLLKFLGDENGWTRDMAQRLLVESKDTTVIRELKKIIAQGGPLTQVHALWTMDGLNQGDPESYFKALGSTDPRVAQTALRLIHSMLPENRGLKEKTERFIADNYGKSDSLLQMQMILVARYVDQELAFRCSQEFLKSYGHLPVARDAVMSSLQDREFAMLKELLSNEEWYEPNQDREIFIEQLATAITNKGSEGELYYLLGLIGNNVSKKINAALANGILNSNKTKATPIALKKMPKVFKDRQTKDGPLAANLRDRFTWPGKPRPKETNYQMVNPVDGRSMAVGRQKYLNLCASCHGTEGEGMSRFAPPLRQSEWVVGDEQKLAMIILHGMEGPVKVNGKEYGVPEILPHMPSFTTLQDQDIAAIATYIRNSWGHSESAVGRGTVSGVRFRTQGKITPWTAVELDTLVFDIDL